MIWGRKRSLKHSSLGVLQVLWGNSTIRSSSFASSPARLFPRVLVPSSISLTSLCVAVGVSFLIHNNGLVWGDLRCLCTFSGEVRLGWVGVSCKSSLLNKIVLLQSSAMVLLLLGSLRLLSPGVAGVPGEGRVVCGVMWCSRLGLRLSGVADEAPAFLGIVCVLLDLCFTLTLSSSCWIRLNLAARNAESLRSDGRMRLARDLRFRPWLGVPKAGHTLDHCKRSLGVRVSSPESSS